MNAQVFYKIHYSMVIILLKGLMFTEGTRLMQTAVILHIFWKRLADGFLEQLAKRRPKFKRNFPSTDHC